MENLENENKKEHTYPTWKHPNSLKNLKMFKKGESWNPKGRPRKTQAKQILAMLSDQWFKGLTKADIEWIYLHLLNLNSKQIAELAGHADTPIIIKIVAKAIAGNKWFDVVEKMLDRTIWRAVQKIESDWSFSAPTVIEIINPKDKWTNSESDSSQQ